MTTLPSFAKRLLQRLNKQNRRRRRKQRKHVQEGAERYGLDPAACDEQYAAEINRYWRKHYGRSVHPLWHTLYDKRLKHRDVRFVPSYNWWEEIMPFFNDLTLRPTYLDKNLSDSFLSITKSSATLIKRMHGHYYDADNQPLTSSAAHQRLINASQPQIIKGSRTDNGDNIHLLESHNGCLQIDGETTPFTDHENHFGNNYIVQEKITQHPLIAKPHPSSVNTIRIVSFRWQDEIHTLLSILRFGVDGNIFDNASNGGIFCGINQNGETHKTAFDKKGTAHSAHPTSGYEFSNQITIPNYPQLCELAVELHSQIFHFDIVSWDFSISPQSEPIFLEVNFRGSADTYQLASGKPLFGDLTDEVLKTVRESRE